MRYFLLWMLFCLAATTYAQKETFDLIKFQPPANWKKETRETMLIYNTTNKKDRTWCQVAIVKSTISKGTIEQDFVSEWQELVVKNYQPKEGPAAGETQEAEGWKIKTGEGKFNFNNAEAIVMLVTASGYNRCVSIVVTTNHEEYFNNVNVLLESVEMIKPETPSNQPPGSTLPPGSTPPPGSTAGTYAFTTTNFDNGWTSTVQENWVQVTKGTMKVLIHYPDKHVDDYNPDLLAGLQYAWNALVAPRYNNPGNLVFRPQSGWQSIEFAESDAVDKTTGARVHVVLFKKNYSGGSGKYLEFITPDKQSFEKEFGTYENAAADYSSEAWDKIAAMATYNKFAVAASDLKGKWTSNFTGMQQYVNAYTGANAGMNTHASNESFEFGEGGTYHWNLGVASGFVGNIKFQSVKSSGKLTVPDNWHIHFSDIEGKPRNYNASFSCVKGARVLWIEGTAYGKAE